MKLLAFILAVGLSITLTGTPNPAEKCFSKALALYNGKKYQASVILFKQYIESFPDSNGYYPAIFNCGWIYLEMGKNDRAEYYFHQLLTSEAQDTAVNGSIMDPFANYKHRSCVSLGKIWKERKNYDSALHYHALSDTVYPYQHFCGNEIWAHLTEQAETYSELYELKGDIPKAISSIIRYALQGNMEFIDEAIRLSKKLPGSDRLYEQFETALDTIHADRVCWPGSDLFGDYYYILFLDEKMYIPSNDYFKYDEEYSADRTRDMIRQSKFYKALRKMAHR